MNSIVKNTLDKYHQMPKTLKAALWFTVSNILLKGISFITLPIFTRLMTPNEYGILSLYQSWVLIVSIVITLNVWTGGFNVGIAKNPDIKEKFASAAQGLGMTISFFFLTITLLFINPISDFFGLSKVITLSVLLNVIFIVPVNTWLQKKRYDFSYKEVVLVSVLTAVINPLLGYFLVVNTIYKADARIFSILIVEIIFGLILFILNQKKGLKFYDKQIWKYIFCFNIALIPHYLSYQILNQSDRIMIAKMCSNADAAVYSIAYSFSMLMVLITSAVESVITPLTFRKLKEEKTTDLKRIVNFAIILIAFCCILLMCAIPDVFKFLLPKSYYEALYVVPILTLATFFQFMYPLFSNIELFYERKKYIAFASCFGAVLNITLNFIFIGLYGYKAAAYTTLLCYIVFCVLHYIFMNKILNDNKRNRIYDIKFIMIVSLILLICTFIILKLYSISLIRYIIIMLIIISAILNKNKLIFCLKNNFGI